MGFDPLNLIDPLQLRKIPGALSGKKKVRIADQWFQSPWTMATWDAAYNLIVVAGSGNAQAARDLEAIKLAANAGHASAIQIKANFDAVAKLVQAGFAKPSEFVREQKRKKLSETATQKARASAREKVLETTVKRQQQEMARFKKAQAAKQIREAKARSAASKRTAVRQQEKQAYEEELDMLRRQLERRDLADEVRQKLEAQAEKYEALLEEAERKAEGKPVAADVTEATKAEVVEAEQDDQAEAYSSGAPGDVEFNDAGV